MKVANNSFYFLHHTSHFFNLTDGVHNNQIDYVGKGDSNHLLLFAPLILLALSVTVQCSFELIFQSSVILLPGFQWYGPL